MSIPNNPWPPIDAAIAALASRPMRPMTPEEQAAQRENWVRGEMALLGLDNPSPSGKVAAPVAPWMTTASGRRIHYDETDPSVVDLGDIAHHLSQLCRFTGATSRFYSVAEHSVHVMRCALSIGGWFAAPRTTVARAAALHGAHEAYVGDISSPLKRAIGEGFRVIDRNMIALVRARFNLSDDPVVLDLVRRADLLVLHSEAGAFLPDPSWAGKGWDGFRPFGWWDRRDGGRAAFLSACREWGIE